MGANSSKDHDKIPNVVIAGLNGSGKTSLIYTYTKNKDQSGTDCIFPP
jgi:ABC-type molybdenum transport system ATPase subunit/photorepair protein PhrA